MYICTKYSTIKRITTINKKIQINKSHKLLEDNTKSLILNYAYCFSSNAKEYQSVKDENSVYGLVRHRYLL